MRISGVPQLQVIRMERLYGYSDTSYMIGVFTIALLGKSGQSMCDVTPKLRNMLNTYDFVNPGFTKSHTSLDIIVSLENGITYEIVYDCTIMQLQTKLG